MNETGRQQQCPRCSMPGGEQHLMKRMYINFSESVDMCSNPKCMWVQLALADPDPDPDSDSQTRLSAPGGRGGDELDLLLSSLWEQPSASASTFTATAASISTSISTAASISTSPSTFTATATSISTAASTATDSGVDADGGSCSSWEPASSDAGSLCSELAGVGLWSAASEPGGGGGGGWRPASAPAGPGSCTSGSLPAADTRSEPDPAAARLRTTRRPRHGDPRPQSGLSLRTFNNSETRIRSRCESRSASQGPSSLPRCRRLRTSGLYLSAAVSRRPLPAWERAALRQSLAPGSILMFAGDQAEQRRRRQSAARKLKRAEAARLAKQAAAEAAVERAPAAAGCAVTSAAVTATAGRGPAAATAASAVPGSAAPDPRLGPEPRPVFLPPARHARVRATSATEVAGRMNRALAAPELRQLCSALNSSQVFVRPRQVERVRAWAKKKTGSAAP